MNAWGRRRRPLVVAHRGASAERTENTLEAFALAEARGADAVELDVMRCGSGEVVVFHDDDLARLAGRPERVRSTPLSVLGVIELRGGGHIPTLDEVLGALGRDTLVNVELKSEERGFVTRLGGLRDPGLAVAVAGILRKHACNNRALISSFDPIQLARFRRAAPAVPTGLLFHAKQSRPLRGAWAARPLGVAAVHPEGCLVSARAVDGWHTRGLAVNVWTIDDPREMAFLEAVGADAIITNHPEVARAVVGRD
jgi:glycerophosphoryl diester phosphodiesterase